MQFNIEGYPDYKYDDVLCAVVSYKGSYARKLTWVGKTKNVVLYKNGFRRTFTALEIMTMIRKPSAPTPTEGVSTMSKFIIGSKSSNGFSFATTPVEHPSEAVARAEAERLARTNPGKKFVVMKVVGYVEATGVTWK